MSDMARVKNRQGTRGHFSKVTDEVLIAYLATGLSESWKLVRSSVADVEDFIESLNDYPEVAEWMVEDVSMFQNLFSFSKIEDMKEGLEQRLTGYFEQIVEPHSIVMQRVMTGRIGTNKSLVDACKSVTEQPTGQNGCVCQYLNMLDNSINMHVECLETLATMLEDLYDKAVHVRRHAKRLLSIDDNCLYQYSPHLPFSLLHDGQNNQTMREGHIKPFTFQRCYGSHILACRMAENISAMCDEDLISQRANPTFTQHPRTLSYILDEGIHSLGNIDILLGQDNKESPEIIKHNSVNLETALRQDDDINSGAIKYVDEESVLNEQFGNAKEFIRRLETRVSIENQRINHTRFRISHLEADNISRKEFLADDKRNASNFIQRCQDISKLNNNEQTEYNKVIENYIALSRDLNLDVDDLENAYREMGVEHKSLVLHSDLGGSAHCVSKTKKRVVRWAEPPATVISKKSSSHPMALLKACKDTITRPLVATARPLSVTFNLAEDHHKKEFTGKSQNACRPTEDITCLSELKSNLNDATKELLKIKERRDQLLAIDALKTCGDYDIMDGERTAVTSLNYRDQCLQVQRLIQESKRTNRRRHRSIITLNKHCARMLGRLKSRHFISGHLDELITEEERAMKDKHKRLHAEVVDLRRELSKRMEDREKYSTLSRAIGDRQIVLNDEKAKGIPLYKIHTSRKGVEDSKKKISLVGP